MITQDKQFMRSVRRTLRMLNNPDSGTDDCLDNCRCLLEWILESTKENKK